MRKAVVGLMRKYWEWVYWYFVVQVLEAMPVKLQS